MLKKGFWGQPNRFFSVDWGEGVARGGSRRFGRGAAVANVLYKKHCMNEYATQKIIIDFDKSYAAENAEDLVWLSEAVERGTGHKPEPRFERLRSRGPDKFLSGLDITNTGQRAVSVLLTALAFLPKKRGRKFRVIFSAGRSSRVLHDVEEMGVQRVISDICGKYPEPHFMVEPYAR